MDEISTAFAMTYAVALAMLQRDGQWLLQLRDDIATIIYPGHWGLFGGHLDPGETATEAVMRETEGRDRLDTQDATGALVQSQQRHPNRPCVPWIP